MSTTSLMTFAEFEQLPDAPGKRELIDGELIELPPPIFRHSVIAKRFYDLLAATHHKPSLFQETGYRIVGGWLQPDLSVIWPDQRPSGDYLVGGPMVAIEILSPANSAADIERKLTLYLSEGGGEVWVADHKRKIMSVYRKTAGQVVRVVVDSTYTSDLLGITIELSRVFD
jgi:Uma2 family endonuclease